MPPIATTTSVIGTSQSRSATSGAVPCSHSSPIPGGPRARMAAVYPLMPRRRIVLEYSLQAPIRPRSAGTVLAAARSGIPWGFVHPGARSIPAPFIPIAGGIFHRVYLERSSRPSIFPRVTINVRKAACMAGRSKVLTPICLRIPANIMSRLVDARIDMLYRAWSSAEPAKSTASASLKSGSK